MLLGIIGKPNCGKSTFFKAATLANVAIANYPFTTIKPNHGVGYVKIDCVDRDFKIKCNPHEGYCINGKRFVPVDIMDVAGLVPGASEGKGLGNQFLDDLRQADVFIHIVDLSGETNEEGKSVANKNYNPLNDIKFLEEELDEWYLGILKKVWKVFARTVEMKHENFAEAIAKQFSGLKVTEEIVKKAILKTRFNPEKPAHWNDEQLKEFARVLRNISKPMIIAGNKIDKKNSVLNLEKIKKEFPELMIIPCSAESELALREASKEGIIEYIPGESNFKINQDKLNEKQKTALEFIRKNVLEVFESTGVQDVLNKAVFELLKYIAVFPVSVNKLTDSKGNILPDCFLVPEGSTALDFAYAVHTDIGKNFIRAIDIKTKMVVGKEHKLKHRDVIEIIT